LSEGPACSYEKQKGKGKAYQPKREPVISKRKELSRGEGAERDKIESI